MQIEKHVSLPWPPSTNKLWRYSRRGVYRTAKYTKYIAECRQFHMHQEDPFDAPVKVQIWACPPDRRIRDLDNLLKSLLDVCVKLGCLTDDHWVHDLRIKWDNEVVAQGVKIRITLLGEKA